MAKRSNSTEPAATTGEHDPCSRLTCGGIWRFARNYLLLSLLLLAAATGAVHLLSASAETEAGLHGTRLAAESVAGRVAEQVALHHAQIELLSHQLGIVSRLQGGSERYAEEGRLLSHTLAGYPKVTLFTPQVERLESAIGGEIGYALYEMLDTAARGEIPPAEIHSGDAGARSVSLVRPLKEPGSGAVVAIVHAAFSDDLLTRALPNHTSGGGQLTLSQVVDGRHWVIANSAMGGAERPRHQQPIPGTLWMVGYDYQSGELLPALLLPAAILGTTMLLLLLSLLVALSGVRRRLNNDLRETRAVVNELLGKGSSKSRSANLEEFQSLFDWLAKATFIHGTTPNGSGAATPRPKRPPPPRSAAPAPAFGSAATAGYEVSEEEHPAESAAPEPTNPSAPSATLPSEIFRRYDIRGHYQAELSREVAYALGQAIGSEALQSRQDHLILAHDGSAGGTTIAEALGRGVLATGCNLLEVGTITTPMLYFGTHALTTNSGVMVAGTDHGGDEVHLKIVINGKLLSGATLDKLRQRLEQGDLMQGEGQTSPHDLRPDYIERILDDIQLIRPLRVVVDGGNGVAGKFAPDLFRAISCEVTELHCEPDDTLPHHSPDPSNPDSLQDLIAAVVQQQADLGIAFDRDGDRLGIVDSAGKIIWPDRLLILLARDILSRQPGADIVYDVKSSRLLAPEILNAGGRPTMWKSGHTLIREMMKQSDALLGGEFSGHLFIKERWYGFDDALYAAARILEILAMESGSSAELFATIPEEPATPVLLARTPKGTQEKLMKVLAKRLKLADAKLVTVDGIRAEFEDGWGLVRASNTHSALSFRFEAANEPALHRIQEQFRSQIKILAPDFKLPF